jgi:hypothetical protein
VSTEGRAVTDEKLLPSEPVVATEKRCGWVLAKSRR